MIETMLWVNAFGSLFVGTIWSRDSKLNTLFKLGFLTVAALNFYVIFKVL